MASSASCSLYAAVFRPSPFPSPPSLLHWLIHCFYNNWIDPLLEPYALFVLLIRFGCHRHWLRLWRLMLLRNLVRIV